MRRATHLLPRVARPVFQGAARRRRVPDARVTMAAVEAAPEPARRPARRGRMLALLSLALILSMSTWFSASAVIPQLRADWGLGTGGAPG